MNTTNKTVKMSKGFTMIELIFVIVIIGILAAVAIPKLSATRDDAKIATGTQEITQVINEMSQYYTSKGTYDSGADKKQEVTNVKLYTDDKCSAPATEIKTTIPYYFCTQNADKLEVTLKLTPYSATGELALEKGTPAGQIGVGILASKSFLQVFGNDGKIQNGGSKVKFE